ncbi:Uncharacterised protein [Serratia fonticola]|uniref:Uncharacterized protein n=1 Tax=Serratia fonticola TaxID=47917 RepID=A0A4U9UFR4_SERFO|nr:Uncharacterised protein [Serratia fonticola]
MGPLLVQAGGTTGIPVKQFPAFLQAFDNPGALDFFMIEWVEISLAGDVFEPQFQRIHPQLGGGFVNHAFQGKGHLWCTVAAHGSGVRQVGVKGGGFVAEGDTRIQIGDFIGPAEAMEWPWRSISSGIGEHLQAIGFAGCRRG